MCRWFPIHFLGPHFDEVCLGAVAQTELHGEDSSGRRSADGGITIECAVKPKLIAIVIFIIAHVLAAVPNDTLHLLFTETPALQTKARVSHPPRGSRTRWM